MYEGRNAIFYGKWYDGIYLFAGVSFTLEKSIEFLEVENKGVVVPRQQILVRTGEHF